MQEDPLLTMPITGRFSTRKKYRIVSAMGEQ
jgi:hypothetical protein